MGAAFVLVVGASSFAAEPRDISAAIETLRAKYKLPACASAVVENGRIIALGATGLRRADREVRVTVEDVWHIGSCTQSMTATLVGALVDSGKLRWDMPVSEALPHVPCAAGWSGVTIDHLVTQRSGIAAMGRAEWRTLDTGVGTAREQRANFARTILAKSPAQPPGKFAYSNSGYGLLGAILEHASGESYEELLRRHIFAPLRLTSAGFGAPGTLGKTDQPWGHRRDGDRLSPVPPSPDSQFPAALAPAASVHLSLADFARYAAWLARNEPRLVQPETFAHLQTPPGDSSYAGGVWKTELPGIGGAALCHCGHMGGFFAVFFTSPRRSCVVVFNTEGGGWEWLGDEIAGAALQAE